MNGVHDMGGLQAFGPVQLEVNEPIFHAAWERQAMGLTVLMGGSGQWNIDQARSTRESLPPPLYLSSSYYQIWIEALERLLLARGLVSADELRTGEASAPALPVRVIAADQVDAAMARGTSAERPVRTPARFEVGQRVWPAGCIWRATRACHAMFAGTLARCRRCAVCMCCLTDTPRTRPRPTLTRASGFTPWFLTPATCGARRRTRRCM